MGPVHDPTGPLEVVIARSSDDEARAVVGFVVWLLGGAWLVMLLLPSFTPWTLSYWQTVALLVTVGIITAKPTRWLDWARGA